MMKRDPDGLLLREALFARMYIIEKGNAQAACLAAGYRNVQYADVLLANESIQKVIARERAKAMQGLEVDVRRIVQELARIAFFDIRKLFKLERVNGQMVSVVKQPHEFDDDTAAVVHSVYVRKGKSARIRLADKQKALMFLGAHFGMLKTMPGVTDRLAEVIAALQEGPATDENGNPLPIKESIQ